MEFHARPPAPATTVAIDPEGAARLERALGDAAGSLRGLAARVHATLGEAGIDGSVPAAVRAVAARCDEDAADLHRRIVAVRAPAGPAATRSAPESPGPSGPVAAGRRLSAVLDVGVADGATERWLAIALPALAGRRAASRAGLAAVARARTRVAADLYTSSIDFAQARARLAALDRVADGHLRRGRATPAEVDEVVRGLDDAGVRAVAVRVLARWKDARGAEAEALAAALVPLRKRVRDQLAESARSAYTGHAAPRLSELHQAGRGTRLRSAPAGGRGAPRLPGRLPRR